MKTKTKWGMGLVVLLGIITFIWYQEVRHKIIEVEPIVEGQIASERDINASAKVDIWRANLLKEINQFRLENHLPPVRLSELLNKSAQAKADRLAARNEFRHGPEKLPEFIDAITSTTYSFYGENLALWPIKSQPTEKDTVIAWEKSDLHRKVLLNKVYTDMGVGLAKHPQGVLVVLHLAKSNAD